ncbi:MAG: class I SAM-dependent methyltransferase [Gemmatimonadota bacterium]|nr:class I SAM-dependent methyltransferase [Gemmatimonadota bacterium]
MSRRTTPLTEALHAYLLEVSLREPEVMRRLRDETATLEKGHMQISPEQGQFLGLLVEVLGAGRILEVGTFTGYSALAMALAMPEDGTLVACDTDEEWTAIARRYWEEAGVGDRIDLRIAPAAETLADLVASGEAGRFDLVFLDADKRGLDGYYERSLELVRKGGLIAVDNTLWHGRVADPSDREAATEAIRSFNRKVHVDERVSLSLVPIGDGVTLARKR